MCCDGRPGSSTESRFGRRRTDGRDGTGETSEEELDFFSVFMCQKWTEMSLNNIKRSKVSVENGRLQMEKLLFKYLIFPTTK